MPQDDLIAAISAAGYTRGGFVPILSLRLYQLMGAIAARSRD